MKIAGVDFPEPLLDALHGGRLVVFAGAGVSMGPPAGLPDFPELARQVAEGTGQTKSESETEDQFLGRLKSAGADVHQRAAQILQQNNPQPAELHRSLLSLYPKSEDVRIVTTNFDLLFEQAAGDVFDAAPRVFDAPTLPQGRRAQGIVHIHGSVNEPEEMVLTAEDFGRAYLTESDGWARRFLVDLFTNRTVLFIGYSHNDTIMRYLTPSLPRDDDTLRYALIGEHSDTPERWRGLGVQPIAFTQIDKNDYTGLAPAVSGLADYKRRGNLAWQQEISAIARGTPPYDEESAGVIEQALADPVKTRFFIEAADSPEWIDWLDRRGHLDTLFADGELSEQGRMLVRWLASRFAMAHDDALFALLQRHGGQLNPVFWYDLCWQMQDSTRQSPDAAVMTRWVLFLASVIPANANETALSWIAESCTRIGAMDSLLRVYEAITALTNRAPPISNWSRSDMYHYEMQSILTDCITPNLPTIAESALEITSMRLNERHAMLMAWQEGDATWDSDDFSRSAIEPHGQDDFPADTDALIDTARDCLEWLAANRPDAARLWSERYIDSQAPLLRRLAIHTLSARTDLSADDKIAWLLGRCDIHETAARHEIFRVAGIAYPQTGQEIRQELIKAVMTYQAPLEDELERERRSAYSRFNWLHWLHDADPDCTLAKQTLDEILERHPEFTPPEHPDPTFVVKPLSAVQSPWTVEILLTKPVAEIVSELLEYEPTDTEKFQGYHRQAMLSTVEMAAKNGPAWGLELADSIAQLGKWDADLWRYLMGAWAAIELSYHDRQRVLSHLSNECLYQHHARDIAYALSHLVQKTDESESIRWLTKANAVAVKLQPYADKYAGKLAEFWVHSIALWHRQQETPPESLNDEYRSALSGIMQSPGDTGKLGRTILASRFDFLFYVDEAWTVDNLMPLFEVGHEDFQPAWEGFLARGHIWPLSVAERLRQLFLDAIECINHELGTEMRRRFVGYYTAMLTWFITGPNDEWIVKIFSNGDENIRHWFTEQIGYRLRSLDEAQQQEWWNVWLKGYWENRLLGTPAPLDDAEIRAMLGWTNHLPAIYSEAVDLAVRMRIVPLERGFFIRELGKSDLSEKHPAATAKLLVHLGKADYGLLTWYDMKETFDLLLQSNLDTATEVALRETMAKIGFLD